MEEKEKLHFLHQREFKLGANRDCKSKVNSVGANQEGIEKF